MSGFDPAWLRLRARADEVARDRVLLAEAAKWAAGIEAPLIVDLGCGLGATVGAIGPLLPETTRWRLVDADPALLALAEQHHTGRVETCLHDLSRPGPLPITGARLVTASALFDLVSADWTDRLAEAVVAEGAALYAALSYDGATSWSPVHRLDAPALAAFNRHQRGDKGFGPALGGDATPALADAFARRGYQVQMAESPWRLGRGDAALMRSLIVGIAEAVLEDGSLTPAEIAEWRGFRLAQADNATCRVGHQDLFAAPFR